MLYLFHSTGPFSLFFILCILLIGSHHAKFWPPIWFFNIDVSFTGLISCTLFFTKSKYHLKSITSPPFSPNRPRSFEFLRSHFYNLTSPFLYPSPDESQCAPVSSVSPHSGSFTAQLCLPATFVEILPHFPFILCIFILCT